MHWLKKLLTPPKEVNGKPTHAQVAKKTGEILTGSDDVSKQVDKLKTDYTKDLIKLQKKVTIIKRSANKLSNEIDTAVAIAIAAGKLK